MGELAEALAALPSRLTRQIKRLEDRGLVRREVSLHDRRCIKVTVTDTGRTLVEQAMITYASAVRTHFLGLLSRPQVAAMAVACGQIGVALKCPGQSSSRRPDGGVGDGGPRNSRVVAAGFVGGLGLPAGHVEAGRERGPVGLARHFGGCGTSVGPSRKTAYAALRLRPSSGWPSGCGCVRSVGAAPWCWVSCSASL